MVTERQFATIKVKTGMWIFTDFKISRRHTNHCRVGLVTVYSLAHCADQDFIELFCGLFIVLGQQTQQMSYITSHLRSTFMQVKLHQLLYQALKKQWTKARVQICFICIGCLSKPCWTFPLSKRSKYFNWNTTRCCPWTIQRDDCFINASYLTFLTQ